MHWPEVRDLLNRHCGYEMADDEILLLEIGGGLYFIADILLWMLTPRELYNAMGFSTRLHHRPGLPGQRVRENKAGGPGGGNAGMPSHGDGPCTANLPGVVQPDDHDHGGAGKSCDGMTRTATMEAI